MSWHKVSLTADQVVKSVEIKLQEQFNALFVAAGGPQDMAMFASSLESNGVVIFFSPGSLPFAKPLIDTYGGTPSQKPDPKGVALLVGHTDAKDRLL